MTSCKMNSCKNSKSCMSSYRKLRHLCLAAQVLLLAACTGSAANNPVRDDIREDKWRERSVAQRAQDHIAKQANLKPPQVARPQKQIVPRSAPWLIDPIKVNYRNLPAAIAIEQLAQLRPIKLTFTPREVVKVSPPIGAVTIADHLNAICQQANWSYQVHNGVVLIYDIETATFPLSIQPGNTSASVRLRGLSSRRFNGNGGNTDVSNNQVSVAFDPYIQEVTTLLNTLLGTQTAGNTTAQHDISNTGVDPRTSFSVLPSANSVVVTAKPQQMRLVESALAQYNATASRSVLLRIVIFEVEVEDGSDRSLNVDAIRTAAITSGALVNPEPAGEIGTSLTFSFNEGNRFDGSEVVLNWLQSQGQTRIAFDDAVEVRNNAVGTVDATRNRQYVRQIYNLSEAFGGSTLNRSNIEFDELRTGWSINVQPTIRNRQITVRLGVSRSTFVDEEPYSFDDGRVEGTNFVTDDYNRMMAVSLQDGQTKLITSLSSSEDRHRRDRTPWLPWLGDGNYKSSQHRETVMLLTAHVL